MSSRARSVGVPQTAAVGCSAAASASELAPSAATPVTSVARCMTLRRWRTNGVSGTFMLEQYGSSARATDWTAYSCSSRSLLERASDAASARSCASSPVRRIVPASTREVTSPRSSRTSISGVAPSRPSTQKVQHRGYRAARRVSGQRASTGPVASATRSRASTTFSRSPSPMRRTASATASSQSAPVSAPSANVTVPGLRGGSRRGAGAAAGSAPSMPTVVTHQRPPRCPMTTSGRVSTDRPGRPSNANEPNATGPHPGSPTSSRTTAPSTRRFHHRSAASIRSGPVDSNVAARPHPTMPSPRRTQASGACSGSNSSSGPGSAIAAVRTTSGAAAGSVVTVRQRTWPSARKPPAPASHPVTGRS